MNNPEKTTGLRATGGCLCGGVRYEITGELRDVTLCHCSMCRKIHGHVGAYTATSRESLHITEPRGLKWYHSSSIARRGFCGECGSALFWEREHGDAVSITGGSLDAPTGISTALQIFVDSAGDYYAIDRRIPVRKE